MATGLGKHILQTVSIAGLAITAYLALQTEGNDSHPEPKLQRSELRSFISEHVKNNEYPPLLTMPSLGPDQLVKVEYTLDDNLQESANNLLSQYKPDYGAIVILNAKTGEILTMASFERGTEGHDNLATRATFPAASVFKVVTATAAIETAQVNPNDTILYNGGAHTLYRKNVLSDKVTRWTNRVSLKEAFARSLNTAFGRLSMEEIDPSQLEQYTQKFMFNRKLVTDFDVQTSSATVPPTKSFELAEVASGYNRFNTMSPVQGAMIAASIVNDGVMMKPFLVKKVNPTGSESNANLYVAKPEVAETVMSAESASKVQQLMEQTIESGTSRRTFRSIKGSPLYSQLSVGGKTGHLTGENPKGQVDWWVGYAKYKQERIAVAALTVNKKFWTVKSGHLAQEMIKKYFRDALKNDHLQFKSEKKSTTKRHLLSKKMAQTSEFTKKPKTVLLRKTAQGLKGSKRTTASDN